MEVPNAVALVAALAFVALGALATLWLQRMEARNEEVRRLALLAAAEVEAIEKEAEAYYYGRYGGFVRAPDLPEVPSLWTTAQEVAPAAPLWTTQAQEVAPPAPLWTTQAQEAAPAAPLWTTQAQEVAPAAPLWTTQAQEVAPAPLWTAQTAQEVAPAPKEVEEAAAASPAAASPAAGKGVCAMCSKPTTLRCKQCKSVKYCTVKCQIDHWRDGHKDECHPQGHGATQDDTLKNVMAGTAELKDMPFEASTTYEKCDGKAESVDFSRLSTSSEIYKGHEGFQLHAGLEPEPEQSNKQAPGEENDESFRNFPCIPAVDQVPSTHSSAYGLPSIPLKREDNPPGHGARPENSGVMPNNSSTEKKNYVRQQTTSKAVRSYPTESMLFSYKNFVELYSFKKLELHPFGLYNLGNSCYANAVLQCLAFTRPLTAYLLEGHHSQTCSKNEWCFMCELEKVLIEGKHGKSPVSPTGILCHLNEIGVNFGHGAEEDAHEFLRYAIDKMQSASIKEAKKNGIEQLAEETTLVQFTFGGYLRSKIKCTKCQVSSKQREHILDLTVEIDGDISTLDGALRRFTSLEVLDGDNRYHCSRCNSYERAQKKLTILEAPNILTIALKRYQSGILGETRKVVKFPEHLNLSQYMSTTDDSSPVYSLYAVVVHHNFVNATVSGHYVCYVKDSQGKWHEMDDNKVKRVSIQKVLSKCAYMLLYARISPRAPTAARGAILSQGASRTTKVPNQMARSGSFPSGEGRHRSSRHQGGKLSKDDAVHDLIYTLGASDRSSYPVPRTCFSRSNSSSLFSSSDARSSCTFSSDSTDSTRKSSMEYDHMFGASSYMCPVSPAAVMPEEDKLSYLRQRSSWKPTSSSGHDMDEEAGRFARQYQRRYHQYQAVTVKGPRVDDDGETTSFSYADQVKYHQGSSSSRNRSSRFGSSSCKLTEQQSSTGPAFFLEARLSRRSTRRGLSKYFYFTDIQGGFLGL